MLLNKELDADDAEITRTRKVRRGFIAEKYAPVIGAFYDGGTQAQLTMDITFEDGRKSKLTSTLPCTTSTAVAAAAGRRRRGDDRSGSETRSFDGRPKGPRWGMSWSSRCRWS